MNVAVNEMFRSAHNQLLGATCEMDRLVLTALLLELRASKKEQATALVRRNILSFGFWVV